jgi:hypothetical protein
VIQLDLILPLQSFQNVLRIELISVNQIDQTANILFDPSLGLQIVSLLLKIAKQTFLIRHHFLKLFYKSLRVDKKVSYFDLFQTLDLKNPSQNHSEIPLIFNRNLQIEVLLKLLIQPDKNAQLIGQHLKLSVREKILSWIVRFKEHFEIKSKGKETNLLSGWNV